MSSHAPRKRGMAAFAKEKEPDIMDKKRNEYASKMKRNILKWNVEDDKVRAAAFKLKADNMVQYRNQFNELKANRRGLAGKNSAIQNDREAAWEDVKAGVDIVRQALIESINAAKLCSGRLASPSKA